MLELFSPILILLCQINLVVEVLVLELVVRDLIRIISLCIGFVEAIEDLDGIICLLCAFIGTIFKGIADLELDPPNYLNESLFR